MKNEDDWDWADHITIAVLAKGEMLYLQHPVKEAWFWYLENRQDEDVALHTAVADALREAFAAGIKESQKNYTDNQTDKIEELIDDLISAATEHLSISVYKIAEFYNNIEDKKQKLMDAIK